MNGLTGTGALARLALRRDRALIPVWVAVLGLLPVVLAVSFADLYPTATERQEFFATSARDGTFTALYGPLRGSSLGELITWRAGFLPVVVGLISLLVVIRHTRAEEEAGRRELVGATVVGRHAGLAAALAVTCAADLAVALVVTITLIGKDLPAAGSLALGMQLAAAGWVFAAVGAVAAQVTTGAGGARGIGAAVLGAAYAARIAGDRGDSPGWAWLSWLSPIGLVQRIHPYGAQRWWLLAPVATVVAVLVGVAVGLSARRDLGAGLLPDRPGRAGATPALRSPLAVAWRLHRGLFSAWIAGFALLGAVFGGVANGVGDLVGDNPTLRDVFTRLGGRSAIVDAYLASVMSIMAMLAAGYAIQAVLRLRVEETGGRAEPILATAVGRLRWAAGHLLTAALGPGIALLTAGAVTGLVYGLSSGDVGRELPHAVRLAAGQLPAVAVLAAIAVTLFGLLPRLCAMSWAALSACVLLGLVGAGAGASHWLLDVSPFTHTTGASGGSVSAVALAVLTLLAAALAAAGLAGLRRRDIPAS
ncbi:putative exporter of polyketide antibiotics-like protein [Parafrankia sp. Ea1.12]|uniref:ABC transporter permease n=1 Tax=Parafrankia sp. Ea1.12 TaxID=573499 RepID=UPI000DA575DE|nr:ABC transporter permease [Parafrankia sp. Ea1.12]SQD94288.1 putative exporter of polyketide antibiotics-like protein [Parafrankia sp. Ea1.12]